MFDTINIKKHMSKESDSSNIESPYFGQKPTILIQEVFAPDM